MTIDDSFDVAAPVDRVWALLRDVPKVASCMPGAEITEVVDDKTYRAKVSVKAGPVSVTYRATITMTAVDDATHTATIDVQGDDVKGRGGVKATVVTSAVTQNGSTHVELHTDARISGIVATVGGRLIEGVAKKTVAQFAANLAAIV